MLFMVNIVFSLSINEFFYSKNFYFVYLLFQYPFLYHDARFNAGERREDVEKLLPGDWDRKLEVVDRKRGFPGVALP